MGIRNTLGKNKVYITLSHAYYRLLTRVSPTLNSKARYRKTYGRALRLKNPQYFSEKLIWLKLNCYNRSPLVKRACSKVQSLDYVRACGYGNMVLEPLGVWSSVEEIDFDSLPNRFIIKAALGCGGHVFCFDKSTFDREAAKTQLRMLAAERAYLDYSELQYAPSKAVPQQYLAERLLDSEDGRLPDDFKVHCFHGEPLHLMYCFDRSVKGKAQYAMCSLPDWKEEKDFHKDPCPMFPKDPPACLDEMLACARALSAPFPYVRVDFMLEHGRPFFGELTFTPAACMASMETMTAEKCFGKLLDLSKVDVNAFRKLT